MHCILHTNTRHCLVLGLAALTARVPLFPSSNSSILRASYTNQVGTRRLAVQPQPKRERRAVTEANAPGTMPTERRLSVLVPFWYSGRCLGVRVGCLHPMHYTHPDWAELVVKVHAAGPGAGVHQPHRRRPRPDTPYLFPAQPPAASTLTPLELSQRNTSRCLSGGSGGSHTGDWVRREGERRFRMYMEAPGFSPGPCGRERERDASAYIRRHQTFALAPVGDRGRETLPHV